ncbi:MAG TPA: cobalamin-binding protein [Pyrinomonadaceae bacterium]|nr:cobalamin-binding protein [Pyrinomonadaceae bacterium]
MKKKLVLLIFAQALVFTGCGTDVPAVNEPRAATHEVTDDLGRKVVVPVNVRRVVSLAPNLTENIFAVGAGDRLVGVTTFCNYPEAAASIPKVGDTMNPSIERIVAIKPDIVFVSTASQIENFTRTLEQNGIAVYVTNPASMDGVLKNLGQLNDLLGVDAIETIENLGRRITVVRQAVAAAEKARVFVQISKEPLFTVGKQSFLNAIVDAAGGKSVTSDVETAYPKLSKETASALRPEVIILSESPDNQEPNEVFRNSPAVKNGRVYKINADLLSRPGPRLIDALEQIARFLHPEKFPE